MSAEMPHVVVGPVGAAGQGVLAQTGHALLSRLIGEGRRFAATPSGTRWRSILLASDFAAQGWMLWNTLELDTYLASHRGGDTPAALIADVLEAIAGGATEWSAQPDRAAAHG